jgi:hypothetical protein
MEQNGAFCFTCLSIRQMGLDVLPLMKNTDDFDRPTSLAVEGDVPSHRVASVSRTDIITAPASVRLLRQEVKRLIHPGRFRLIPAPHPLRNSARYPVSRLLPLS